MQSPPLAFTLLSDGRLLLLAMTLAAAASFVSLSIFGYASRGRAHRRAGWFLLAAVCSAFGLWAAHFIALLSHRNELPGALEDRAAEGRGRDHGASRSLSRPAQGEAASRRDGGRSAEGSGADR